MPPAAVPLAPLDQLQPVLLDRALESRRIRFQEQDVIRLEHRLLQATEHAPAVPDDAVHDDAAAGA